jgi:hypothetical protein
LLPVRTASDVKGEEEVKEVGTRPRERAVFAEPEPSRKEEPDRVTAHTSVFCIPCTPPSSSSAPTSRTSPLHRHLHFGKEPPR